MNVDPISHAFLPVSNTLCTHTPNTERCTTSSLYNVVAKIASEHCLSERATANPERPLRGWRTKRQGNEPDSSDAVYTVVFANEIDIVGSSW